MGDSPEGAPVPSPTVPATAPEEPPPTAASPERNPLRRLYHWILSWANHPWGSAILAVLAFLDSFIFPIPPLEVPRADDPIPHAVHQLQADVEADDRTQNRGRGVDEGVPERSLRPFERKRHLEEERRDRKDEGVKEREHGQNGRAPRVVGPREDPVVEAAERIPFGRSGRGRRFFGSGRGNGRRRNGGALGAVAP